MLTQFQIIQRQAAFAAACPRSRALALSDLRTRDLRTSGVDTSGTTTVSASSVIAPSVPSAWSLFAPISVGAGMRSSVLGAVAVEPRRSPSADGRRAFGFGFGSAAGERAATDERPVPGYAALTLPVPMAEVRTDRAALVAEGNGNGKARRNDGSGTTGINGSNSVTQQDKQHLTTRRGPVTWRPPH